MTKITAEWVSSPASQAVCAMLVNAGFQAWFVGGCVRNALLGLPVADLDVTTDARPQDVMSLARAAGLKVIPTGIDHGTVTVMSGGTPFEVTTFREDISTDGRRATVAFASDIATDAARRDFTMNALYAGPDGAVFDPLGGLADLRARRLRFIGDPDARIAEDYLRILRFFRFHAIYGDAEGGIDAEGLAACAGGLDGLDGISRERIGAEMRKLLAADDPAPALAAMRACGVLMRLLPGAGTGLLQVLIHVEQVAAMAPDWLTRLAALGGEDVGAALRLSKVEVAKLVTLRNGLDSLDTPLTLGYRHGYDIAQSIVALRAAAFEREVYPADMEQARRGATLVFPLTAADLMPDLNGPALGEKLKELETEWLISDGVLTRDDLLKK